MGCILILLYALSNSFAPRQFGPIAFPFLPSSFYWRLKFFKPWGSAEYVVIILGATAIFYGLTDLISQYRINKLRKEAHATEQQNKMGGDSIEDTDYEEVK
ncbi:MAG: hypothetical protein ACLTXP_09395 [Odoribacter splanchnicus]